MILNKVEEIIITVVLVAFFILSFFINWHYKNDCTKALFILAAIIYSLVLIPLVFHSLLQLPPKTSLHYDLIHFLYVLLPIGLVGQVILFEKIWWLVGIVQAISIINLIRLYRGCKYLIKKRVKYLRCSNKFISGIFTFFIIFLCLHDGYLKPVFSLLFLLPLFCLQSLYDKIDLFVEDEKPEHIQ